MSNNTTTQNQSPQILIKEIQDIYMRTNMQNLSSYFQAQNQLLNFKFFEIVYTQAVTNIKVPHGLKFVPQDIIMTKISGVGTVQFNTGLFDSTNMNITTTGACRLRFYIGTYWNFTSSVVPSPTDFVQFGSNGLINPMQTTGDTIYASNASGAPARLGIGAKGTIYLSNGSIPGWSTLASAGIMPNPMNTVGAIPYSTNVAGVPASLALGASGTFLTAGSTAPVWASAQTLGVIRKVNTVYFNTVGANTYTPSTGMVYCIVELLGGGGGGGGSNSGTGTIAGAGAGGGGGGYARRTYTAAQIGSSTTITIGGGGAGGFAAATGSTGGTSSILTMTAAGGSGGAGSTPATGTGWNTAGGGGGGATNYDFAFQGGIGGGGFVFGSLQNGFAGFGGASFWGSVTPVNTSPTINGRNGVGYGSGGSGAASNGATAYTGGSGAQGVGIVTEFIAI